MTDLQCHESIDSVFPDLIESVSFTREMTEDEKALVDAFELEAQVGPDREQAVLRIQKWLSEEPRFVDTFRMPPRTRTIRAYAVRIIQLMCSSGESNFLVRRNLDQDFRPDGIVLSSDDPRVDYKFTPPVYEETFGHAFTRETASRAILYMDRVLAQFPDQLPENELCFWATAFVRLANKMAEDDSIEVVGIDSMDEELKKAYCAADDRWWWNLIFKTTPWKFHVNAGPELTGKIVRKWELKIASLLNWEFHRWCPFHWLQIYAEHPGNTELVEAKGVQTLLQVFRDLDVVVYSPSVMIRHPPGIVAASLMKKHYPDLNLFETPETAAEIVQCTASMTTILKALEPTMDKSADSIPEEVLQQSDSICLQSFAPTSANTFVEMFEHDDKAHGSLKRKIQDDLDERARQAQKSMTKESLFTPASDRRSVLVQG